MSFLTVRGWATSVAVSAKLACVTAAQAGLHVIDISHPSAPNHLGTNGDARFFWSAAVVSAGSRAWIASASGDLWSIDLSTPSHPLILGHYAPGRG
ncbi:MAG: hypothetical protein AB9869_04975 [Verrucomicrobiia bacterium]